MSNISEQVKINKCLKLLDRAYRHDVDLVKIHASNTLEHEMAKLKICYNLKKDGKSFVCEARFKEKGRADILVLNDFLIIEILHSETEKEALTKKSYYPKECDIKFITSSEVLSEPA